MEYIDGPSGQERCLGSSLMIIIAYQAIGVEKTVFGSHFQGSRQVLLNTLTPGRNPNRCIVVSTVKVSPQMQLDCAAPHYTNAGISNE